MSITKLVGFSRY